MLRWFQEGGLWSRGIPRAPLARILSRGAGTSVFWRTPGGGRFLMQPAQSLPTVGRLSLKTNHSPTHTHTLESSH